MSLKRVTAKRLFCISHPGGSPMYKQLTALLGFLAGLLIAFAIAAVMNGGL